VTNKAEKNNYFLYFINFPYTKLILSPKG
jgi:hypothetical protein